MKKFHALFENLLIDSRLSEPPRQRTALSAVWALPMVLCADTPDAAAPGAHAGSETRRTNDGVLQGAATSGNLQQAARTRRAMRTIFVRVADEPSPLYAPVLAEPITSTTFSIARLHPDFTDAALEFGLGENVRCKTVRLLGPDEATARQRMVAVERVA